MVKFGIMAAPKGNQFWKERATHGRDKIFESPKNLWASACEYFEWCDDNPWYRQEAVKAGDHFGETVQSATARPYTIGGLCIFLDIDENTFERYRKEKAYKDFWGIANKIANIIRTQKFEGAAVGAFNANIIARDLGLAEQQRLTAEVIRPVLEGGKELPKDFDGITDSDLLGSE